MKKVQRPSCNVNIIFSKKINKIKYIFDKNIEKISLYTHFYFFRKY